MSDFATDLVAIYGFSKVATDRKVQSDKPLAINIPACIQPVGTDVMVLGLANISVAKAMIIYLEGIKTVVKNGYKLIDQNGVEYIVRGEPEVWNDSIGNLSHQKIAVEKAV